MHACIANHTNRMISSSPTQCRQSMSVCGWAAVPSPHNPFDLAQAQRTRAHIHTHPLSLSQTHTHPLSLSLTHTSTSTHSGTSTAAVRGCLTPAPLSGSLMREVDGVPSINGMGSPRNAATCAWIRRRESSSNCAGKDEDVAVAAAAAAAAVVVGSGASDDEAVAKAAARWRWRARPKPSIGRLPCCRLPMTSLLPMLLLVKKRMRVAMPPPATYTLPAAAMVVRASRASAGQAATRSECRAVATAAAAACCCCDGGRSVPVLCAFVGSGHVMWTMATHGIVLGACVSKRGRPCLL